MPAPPTSHPGHGPQRLALCLAALAAALAALTAITALAAAGWAGQRLIDVLEQLRAQGFNLVYSSDVVTDDLLVENEPRSSQGVALLAEILAEHGLALRQVARDTYAIVIADRAARPAGTPESAVTPGRVVTLDAIVVAASRYVVADDATASHTFMDQEQVESLPRLAEDSLKVVQRLPGVAGNGVSGLAHVRGGEENETLILFDGLALHEPFHLRNVQSPVSLLSARIVDSLDVHNGGFTAQYGDRMSAVIDAASVRPATDSYNELGMSLFHASALASRRFDAGRGQWLLSGRRSNLGEISQLWENQVAQPTYFDVFGRLDYTVDASTDVALNVLASGDSIRVFDDRQGESSQAGYQNAYAWINVEHRFSDALRASLIASWTGVSTERSGEVAEPGRRTGTVDDERSYRIGGLKFDLAWSNSRWMHSGGVELRDVRARYDYASSVVFEPDYPFPGAPGAQRVRQIELDPSGQHMAAYLSSRLRLTDDLTAEAGLRWDRQTYSDANDADDRLGPRLNVLYALGESTRLRASWGRHQQFQDINELQVEDGVETFGPSQRVDHLIVAAEHDLGPAATLRIEAYRKQYASLRPRFENLFDPVAWLPELAPDRIRIAPDSAKAEGVELLLTRRDSGPWSGWFSYTWSRVTDRLDGQDVLRSWDQTHALNAGLRWTDAHWDVTLAGTWHTGWPTTPVEDTPTGSFVAGARNTARYPSFSSIDLRASRRFDVARGELLGYLEISNALNRRNPCCVSWSVEPGAAGSLELEREYDHWLPLVPSFGVLWTF